MTMSLKRLLIRSILQNRKYFINSCSPIVLQCQHDKRSFRERWNNKKITALALFSSLIVGSTINKDDKQKQKDGEVIEAGEKRPDLPTYKAEEVSKHDDKSSFWVIYKRGVYDVTTFLPSHPGGEQIMNAAGLSIEPFWNVYGMHKTQDVYKTLESYRIGNLHDDDVVDHSDDEMWAREPYRDKRLIVKTERPFNAEIPPEHQIEHFDTPNELFYVRQHMPVPELSAATHRLTVRVVAPDGDRALAFSLEELRQRFEPATVRAALMCAGNRRSEMHEVKAVKGLGWRGGAVSCARWGGVRLRDVLLAAGLSPHPEAHLGQHVVFTGSDIDATGVNFSTSIPLHMAMDPTADILLATHMNGAELPPDHGYPLRVVVPGAPAVRSVKWLESITVSSQESQSHWHQRDYRGFGPSETWESARWEAAPPVYGLPVTSAVCRPRAGERLSLPAGATHLAVQGYAYAGGGAAVLRVDVSGDGGASWRAAALRSDAAPPRRHYAWALWTARLPLHGQPSSMDIWVKATDSNFNTQPENFDDIWNIRGILANAYHKITVHITYV